MVDIGGTTTDVGLLQQGFPRPASTEALLAGVRINQRVPDIHSIGTSTKDSCTVLPFHLHLLLPIPLLLDTETTINQHSICAMALSWSVESMPQSKPGLIQVYKATNTVLRSGGPNMVTKYGHICDVTGCAESVLSHSLINNSFTWKMTHARSVPATLVF